MLTEKNRAIGAGRHRRERGATAVCLSPWPTPTSPQGSTSERRPVSRRCLSVGLCVREVWTESAFSLCGSLFAFLHGSPPQAGQNGTGRRAPNWAQMAATDKDGGGTNTLINNYQNNAIQLEQAGTGGHEETRKLGGRMRGNWQVVEKTWSQKDPVRKMTEM